MGISDETLKILKENDYDFTKAELQIANEKIVILEQENKKLKEALELANKLVEFIDKSDLLKGEFKR